MSGGRMRVGVNLLWLVPGDVGGSEDYAVSLVRELGRTGDVEMIVFCQPQLSAIHPDLAEMATVVPGPRCQDSRGARVASETLWLPRQARRLGVDVVHHLGGALPPTGWGRGEALTIYDLQPLIHPERFGAAKRVWLRAIVPQSARRAGVVFTLSEHVRRQVIDGLGVPDDRVEAVPPGVVRCPRRNGGSPRPSPAGGAAVRRRYGLTGDVLLYPAISHPHKNHGVLIRALPEVLARHPGTTLVLTGRPGPVDDELDALARRLGVGHAVRRLGRIDRADLDALYHATTALLFPSTYEGFGLPLLEAMDTGLPILAADASAIPEVAGDGALLLTPGDADVWANAIVSLLADPGERAELAEAARRNAKRFRWEDSVAAILAAYHRLVRV